MTQDRFIYRNISIAVTVFLELASMALLTTLLTTDFFHNMIYWETGYTMHRILTFAFSYFLVVLQSGIKFVHKMDRPEKVALNSFKTCFYMTCISAFVFVLVGKSVVLSSIWLAKFFCIYYFVLLFLRLCLRAVLRFFRRKGYAGDKVCLIGHYVDTERFIKAITDRSYGYYITGYFAEEKDEAYPETIPYLGGIDEVESWISDNKDKGVSRLFCVNNQFHIDRITEIYKFCENNLIYFNVIPCVSPILGRTFGYVQIGNVPVFTLRKEPLNIFRNRAIKRCFDIIFSGLVLVTIFPVVYVIFGIWIKLTSPGPIIFRQRRSGLNNRDFCCLKFRSMTVNEDADNLQATKDDARVTRVGEIMRKTSIDELPQFINVFFGSMSVVGPRPHMLKHTEQYGHLIDKYMVRHFVKPGITGWAQTTGFRGETSDISQMEGRILKDIWYIENWSFLLDIVIIAKTIINGFRGEENAY